MNNTIKEETTDVDTALSEMGTDEDSDGLELPIPMVKDPEVYKIGLIGEINEAILTDVLFPLTVLNSSGKGDEKIEVIISTLGGNADDMFAIYDMMRSTRNNYEVATLGLGKVMSAGVLLLSAGTKGKRRIGENCRVMIHAVNGGHAGTVHQIENDFAEMKKAQRQYIKALVSETKMTKKVIKKLFKRKVDVYLDAYQAVAYGIADEVI